MINSLLPRVLKPLGDFSLVSPKQIEKGRAVEHSLYISDEFEVSPNLSISGGLRTTIFTLYGPGTQLRYHENSPWTILSISDTVSYSKYDVIKSHPGFEFRISARMILSPRTSIKFGVQRMYQYLHLISNTTSMSPTDVWKLSDRYIKPEMNTLCCLASGWDLKGCYSRRDLYPQ